MLLSVMQTMDTERFSLQLMDLTGLFKIQDLVHLFLMLHMQTVSSQQSDMVDPVYINQMLLHGLQVLMLDQIDSTELLTEVVFISELETIILLHIQLMVHHGVIWVHRVIYQYMILSMLIQTFIQQKVMDI